MSMTSRDRFITTLSHQQPDGVCVDFGATHVTGIHASVVSKLRKVLVGGDDFRVKIVEPYQMLGEIDDELAEAMGVDVVGVMPPKTMFGFVNEDWKPFTLFDDTEVLVPGQLNVTEAPGGGWFIYPEGDTSVPPSGHMPKDGFYFDALCRQEPLDDAALDPADNLEEFGPLGADDLEHLAAAARRAAEADKGAILSVPGSGFGDIALVPAMWLKHPKGIRDVEEWYVSTVLRRDYVREVFQRQCEIALGNIERLIAAVGDDVQAAFTTGTDFGTQNGLFLSVESYRELYKPLHKTVNDFIHRHSNWKVFIHSCGAVAQLIPEFIDAGFDILNPVQCSCCGMEPEGLKSRFGGELAFWGGGVDTQKTFPFGSPREVYDQVRRRIDILGAGGGFVFNTIHNIQANTPIENIEAMLRAVRDSGGQGRFRPDHRARTPGR